MPWAMALLLAVATTCRCVVLIVTAYAVFWLDRSGWWFAVTAPLMLLIPAEFSFERTSRPEA